MRGPSSTWAEQMPVTHSGLASCLNQHVAFIIQSVHRQRHQQSSIGIWTQCPVCTTTGMALRHIDHTYFECEAMRPYRSTWAEQMPETQGGLVSCLHQHVAFTASLALVDQAYQLRVPEEDRWPRDDAPLKSSAQAPRARLRPPSAAPLRGIGKGSTRKRRGSHSDRSRPSIGGCRSVSRHGHDPLLRSDERLLLCSFVFHCMTFVRE